MDRKGKAVAKRVDAVMKALFEAKAAEPAPEHLVALAHELDGPQKKKAS